MININIYKKLDEPTVSWFIFFVIFVKKENKNEVLIEIKEFIADFL